MPISIGPGKSIGVNKLAHDKYSLIKSTTLRQSNPDDGEGASSANSGIIQVQCGEAVTAGNAAAYNSSDGKYYNATCDFSDNLEAVGIFQNSVSTDEINYVIVARGVKIGVDATITLTAGGPVYLRGLDVNDINISPTLLTAYAAGPPVEDFVQYLGLAESTDSFILDIKKPLLMYE